MISAIYFTIYIVLFVITFFCISSAFIYFIGTNDIGINTNVVNINPGTETIIY